MILDIARTLHTQSCHQRRRGKSTLYIYIPWKRCVRIILNVCISQMIWRRRIRDKPSCLESFNDFLLWLLEPSSRACSGQELCALAAHCGSAHKQLDGNGWVCGAVWWPTARSSHSCPSGKTYPRLVRVPMRRGWIVGGSRWCAFIARGSALCVCHLTTQEAFNCMQICPLSRIVERTHRAAFGFSQGVKWVIANFVFGESAVVPKA